MVGSIDPRCETVPGTHCPYLHDALPISRVAETILASGPKSPHQQAGHMDASDPIKPSKKLLWHGGRPHMASGPKSPHQQAGHMDASDPIKPSKKLLWHGGRPHMANGPKSPHAHAGHMSARNRNSRS